MVALRCGKLNLRGCLNSNMEISFADSLYIGVHLFVCGFCRSGFFSRDALFLFVTENRYSLTHASFLKPYDAIYSVTNVLESNEYYCAIISRWVTNTKIAPGMPFLNSIFIHLISFGGRCGISNKPNNNITTCFTYSCNSFLSFSSCLMRRQMTTMLHG